MSTAGWASCLDSFADHLAVQRSALDAGAPERITTFVPTPGLGPLPAELFPRARDLQAQAQALTEVLAEERAHALAALEQLRQPTEARRSAYLDSMA